MKVTLLAFANAAEKLGWRSCTVAGDPSDTPRTLFARIAPDFNPGTARVAVNCEYGGWDTPIGALAREIAIIPPVSGG